MACLYNGRVKKSCSVPTCNLPLYARGWCQSHYSRWKKTGDVQPDVPIAGRQKRSGNCRVEGCERPIEARRLCVGHLRREDKFGDVQAHIPLKRPSDGSCSVPDCPRPHAGLGWCEYHYAPFRRYKLTPEAYAALLESQGGGCAICGTQPTPEDGMHVDHDHGCCPPRKKSCGKCVRGLLCSRCNLMIGYAKDDPEVLRQAIRYLTTSRG
ncbi:endonuclease VII domain-containing protein [Streptomyces sp. NPDC006655]|uniref:endonuclease VII domain-containing protein n=1 Tax=Streptomyces sp. NPDC006655 TaxID=3156898 RepID=UPI0034532458